MNDATHKLIWIRGAGELASAVAHLLYRLDHHVFMSEINPPLAIRRSVSFSDAIHEGTTQVEGITAQFCNAYQLPRKEHWTFIPLFADQPEQLLKLSPQVLVDCRMLKTGIDDLRSWANHVIGLGPGFHTSENCHTVIETMRGHDLGRVITHGAPLADTGIPGNLGGESSQRLVRSPGEGLLSWMVNFGDLVDKDQALGHLNNGTRICAPIAGKVRGLISEKTPVFENMKIGDIDPRGVTVNHFQISDKARAIAHGVLEAILLGNEDDKS